MVKPSLSEKRSPARLRKLQVESGGHGLSSLAFVVGLVHPHLLDSSINFSRDTLSTFGFIFAFSTGNESISAVGERESKVAPDRSIASLLLVARSDSSKLAVCRSGLSRSSSYSLSFDTSLRSGKASDLFANHDGSKDGLRGSEKRSGTDVEGEEISLTQVVVSDSQKLSTSSNDSADIPFLRSEVVKVTRSKDRSPSSNGEFEVESTRDNNSLVKGLVQPNFLEVTINSSANRRSYVSSSGTSSTGD